MTFEVDLDQWNRIAALKDQLDEFLPYDQLPFQEGPRSGTIFDGTILAVMGFHGFRPREGALPDWRLLGRETCVLTVEYFHGDWRKCEDHFGETLDEAQCRATLPWTDTYVYGLMWSLCFDQEAELRRLIEWVDEDLPDDEGTLDRSREDQLFHILLAKWLRGEAEPVIRRLREVIAAGRPRRPRILLQAWEAILAGDADGLAASLLQHLKQFMKSEFRTNRPDCTVSLDGTILWHLARRRGMALPQFEPQWMELIVRP